MKQKPTTPTKNVSSKNMHWSAKLTIKFGTLASLWVLLAGFLPERSSFLALSMGKTAVYMFALSVVGGLLFDVIAQRTGIRE